MGNKTSSNLHRYILEVSKVEGNKEILDIIEEDNFIIEIRSYHIPENNIENVYHTLAQLLYNQAVESA